jgi:hypothetical protein
VEIQELGVRAWAALGEGKKQEGLQQMKSAAELEDGTEESAVTPGPLEPARELLGEMLLEVNEPAQALEQFEATLTKEMRGQASKQFSITTLHQVLGLVELTTRTSSLPWAKS